jgi:hypothetical protein
VAEPDVPTRLNAMTDFEQKLARKLDDKSTSGEILFKLYNDYVKFVGKLDALPPNELGYYDIRGPNSKVMPFSKWPTKSTRALAKKMWDQYNVNLQSGDPSAEETGMDPCEDPDFMSDLLNACVRTSMRMGVDKRVAFRQCTKQLENMMTAIRAACQGRGLVPEKQKEFLDGALELLGEVAGKPVKLQDLTPEDRALFTDLVDAIGYQKPRDF